MKHSCENLRELLDKNQAKSAALPAWASRHLAGCRACRDFALNYAALVTRLKSEFDAVLAPLPKPDLAFLNDSPRFKPAGMEKREKREKGNTPIIYRSLLRAAVIIIVLLAGISGYLGFSFLTPHAVLTEENRLFIDNLYASASGSPRSSVFNLLPPEQAGQEAILPAAWFQVITPADDTVFPGAADSLPFTAAPTGSL